ncbi:unnamed protein product [Arabis nemorensis]|uniref:Uncharacterized protein n=1 Tax=Arabis nemorensis TaxID=586526 RepID=A0A565AZ42_9BRAS|nr:unnamed protein product [Arabis nemorensis]
MPQSCFDVPNVLGFMSQLISTFLFWLFSQWILLSLKKSSRVIPEEPIILTMLFVPMLFVPATLLRCQQSQTSFVHSLIWFTDSTKGFVSYRREFDLCVRASNHSLADF